QSPLDRKLAASHGLDRNFLLQARELLPAHSSYAVVTGSKLTITDPTEASALLPFTAYWLLPRRQVADPKQAQWILSYGGDLGSLRLQYARTVQISPGLAIAEVKPG